MVKNVIYLTIMLYFLTKNTLVSYVQFICIIGSKRKPSSLLEKNETESEHFVTESMFECLKFDYSSSETVSNQQIPLRAMLLVTAYSWISD